MRGVGPFTGQSRPGMPLLVTLRQLIGSNRRMFGSTPECRCSNHIAFILVSIRRTAPICVAHEDGNGEFDFLELAMHPRMIPEVCFSDYEKAAALAKSCQSFVVATQDAERRQLAAGTVRARVGAHSPLDGRHRVWD